MKLIFAPHSPTISASLTFQLCSCAFLGVGVWLRLSYEGYATLLPDHQVLSADSIFLAIGVIGFVVSFFGCCGAWVQSRCLLVLVSWRKRKCPK